MIAIHLRIKMSTKSSAVAFPTASTPVHQHDRQPIHEHAGEDFCRAFVAMADRLR